MPRVADPDKSPVVLGSVQRFGKWHFLRSLLVKKHAKAMPRGGTL